MIGRLSRSEWAQRSPLEDLALYNGVVAEPPLAEVVVREKLTGFLLILVNQLLTWFVNCRFEPTPAADQLQI